jgi:trimeric autotransporter adhesin
MAWYNTGTIALTNGSATVTGSGTNFSVGAQIGEALYAPDGKLYEIQTINSATVITLASNYLGSTASAQGYQIIPTQSLVADLASDVTDLISDFADVRDYAGNGKFNDGAVGTPGITFTQDQDNGLYRIGSNNWALAAGGIKQVDLSATDVEINYAGVKKLATTSTGIDVTGTVTADGLVTNTAGTSNFIAGVNAGNSIVSGGNYNVVVGDEAGTAITTGVANVFVGYASGDATTTGQYNVAMGHDALTTNTTGANNVAVGFRALDVNTTASNNTAVGYDALGANTTGDQNVSVGSFSMDANSSGRNNAAFGMNSLSGNTTADENCAIGTNSLFTNTTGTANTGLGTYSLQNNSTASNNTGLGYRALFTNSTGSDHTIVGARAGEQISTGSGNTFLGRYAGFATNTGHSNVFIGYRTNGEFGAGHLVTTGSKNTIIGGYNGNQGGLDIRTTDNNIVLSDGDGNIGFYVYQNTNTHAPLVYSDTTASGANVHIATGGRLYRSTSSLRYKNTVNDATHGLAELLTLRPVTYKGNSDGDLVFGGLIAEEVHDAGLTEFVQYDDEGRPDALAYSNMVSICVKAIQEQQAIIESLTARIEALES